MSIDVISSDAPRRPEPGEAPRRAPVGTTLTALAAAASLVVVAGAATVAYRAFRHTTEPEALVPASAFAFARVNLDLPGSESAALQRLADRFPDSPTHRGTGSARDRLFRAMFAKSSDPHVDYDRDVRPWLGDRAAVAGWLDKSGKPELEALIQVRGGADGEGQVRSLVRRNGGTGVVRFTHGYAVIADSNRLADEALTQARKSSLADVSSFRSDVAALPGPQVVVAWADGAGVKRALSSALGPAFERGLRSAPMLGLARGDVFAGHVAAGLRVTSDYVEIDTRTVGRRSGGTAPSSLLTGLPDGTIGALEIGDPGSAVTGIAGLVGTAFTAVVPRSSMSSSSGGVAVAPVPVHVAPSPFPITAVPIPARSPTSARQSKVAALRAAQLRRQLAQAQARALASASARPLTSCSPGPCAGAGVGTPRVTTAVPPPVVTLPLQPPAPPDPFAEIRRYTGLSFPGDVRTLLGHGAVVAYGGVRLNGVPKVAVRTRPDGLGVARPLADRLVATLSREAGLTPAVETTGGDLVLATTADYAGEVASGGSFGDQSQVRLALGDVPSRVTFAGYLDLGSIWPLAGTRVPPDVTHVHAIGFWGSSEGGVERAQVRVVIG